MKIKNTAKGGRGIGSDGVTVEWAPGEIKDVDAAFVAKAKKDSANAELFEADLVEVSDAAPVAEAATDEPATEAKKAAKK